MCSIEVNVFYTAGTVNDYQVVMKNAIKAGIHIILGAKVLIYMTGKNVG